MDTKRLLSLSDNLTSIILLSALVMAGFWSVSGNVIFPFMPGMPYISVVPGLLLGMLLLRSIAFLKLAINLDAKKVSKSKYVEKSRFEAFFIFLHARREMSNVMGALVIFFVTVALNGYQILNSSSIFNPAAILYVSGLGASLFFYSWLSKPEEIGDLDLAAARSGKDNSWSAKISNSSSGFMLTEAKDRLIFTMNITTIGKMPEGFAGYNLEVMEKNISDFRVFSTMEQCRTFYNANFASNFEILAQATLAKAQWFLNPKKRPDYFVMDSGSTGDVFVWIAGNGFGWYFPCQRKYAKLLLDMEKKYNSQKNSA